METTDEEWVTDQRAIDTIVVLGLMPGDQVRINGKVFNLSSRHGEVVTITEHRNHVGKESFPDDYPGIITVAQFDKNWILCRENIGAWRRPTKS